MIKMVSSQNKIYNWYRSSAKCKAEMRSPDCMCVLDRELSCDDRSRLAVPALSPTPTIFSTATSRAYIAAHQPLGGR